MNTNKTVLHHYLGTELVCEVERLIYPTRTDIVKLTAKNYSDFITKNYKIKLALHSMNRLTMPLENGEIPLVELAKIVFPYKWEVIGKIAKSPSGIRFWYDDGFHLTGNVFQQNQLQLFDYLRKNHFNLYNLPESEYIEKSTLKI